MILKKIKTLFTKFVEYILHNKFNTIICFKKLVFKYGKTILNLEEKLNLVHGCIE